VSVTNEEVYPLKLLRALQSVTYPDGYDFIFRGFNGRLVVKNPGKTAPMVIAIKHTQYMRYLSLLFGVILGLTPEELRANMVLNRVVWVLLPRLLTRASPWSCKVIMVIELHSKARKDT
jgi:hypothetical protein